VVKSARRAGPIRIGVNAAACQRNAGFGGPAHVSAALEQIDLLESLDFGLIKISLKAFDVPPRLRLRLMARKTVYPLHLASPKLDSQRGAIRSAVGIGFCCTRHWGHGPRLADSRSAEEVLAAYEILKALDLREHGPPW